LGSGRVTGDIYTGYLQIEAGGVLEGVCHVPAISENESEIAIPMKPAFDE
jgi:cytoskeletal protein CcmA (bactofilin family)